MYSLIEEVISYIIIVFFIIIFSCVLSYHAGYIKGVNYKQQPIDVIRY